MTQPAPRWLFGDQLGGFLDRHRDRFGPNPRMRQAVRGLDRLRDLEELVDQEERRGSRAP